jgi:ribosomal protein L12E/L44/L45/RPP1/RPP2
MPIENPDVNDIDEQLDEATGKPVSVAPNGAKTEEEIERDQNADGDDAALIDPDSRIPRPVQPDLA